MLRFDDQVVSVSDYDGSTSIFESMYISGVAIKIDAGTPTGIE
jgi:hypothetical protein